MFKTLTENKDTLEIPSSNPLLKGTRAKTSYYGVYLHYRKDNGEERWRSHVYWYFEGNSKKTLKTIGYFKTAKEAAEAYDAYVKEQGFPLPLNFDENGEFVKNVSTKRHLTVQEETFIAEKSPYMTVEQLSIFLDLPQHRIKDFIKRKVLKVATNQVPVVIIDKRDMYEAKQNHKE